MNTSKKPQFVDFKQLKEQVSIRQIIEHYDLLGDFSERGDRLSGCCPFCDSDNETTFRVSLSKNCFNCFSCEAQGNMLDFVRLRESCSIRAAGLLVAEWFGIETEAPRKRKASQGKRPSGSSKQGRVAETPKAEPAQGNKPLGFELELDPDHPWFEEIGLEPETVEEFGLGFCEKGTMRGCIAFPVHNAQGDLVAYIGRVPTDEPVAGVPLWRYPSTKRFSSELEVFNLHRVEPGKLGRGLLLAADPLEAVQLWQDGERNVVSFLSSEVPVSVLHHLCALFD